MTKDRFQIVNLDHLHTLPGGIGLPDDRAVVVDTERTEPNGLTGKPQPAIAFRGSLQEAQTFVNEHKE